MALERIFAHFKEGGPPDGGYDPADPATYEQFIQAIIRDSRDYEGSVYSPLQGTLPRNTITDTCPALNPDGSPYTDTQIIQDPNATYEQILGYTQESANKSTYVSTDVRDAVMLTLPSLIRLFAASENVVNLVPRTEADVDAAAQQTNYINYVFWQDNPGFLILHGAFKDALTVRTGFVKWWTDDNKEKTPQELRQPLRPAGPDAAEPGPDRQTRPSRRARTRRPEPTTRSCSSTWSTSPSSASWACRPRKCASTATPDPSPPPASSATSASSRSMNSPPWATTREQCLDYLQIAGHPELHHGEPAPQPRPLHVDPDRRRRPLRRMVHQGRPRRRWRRRTPLHLHHGRGSHHRP